MAEPVTDLSVSDVASFAWQVPQGRALAIQVILVAAIAVACRWVVTVREATLLFFAAVVALLPPMFTGHAASAGSHDLAIVSLMVHVVAASLWVGGLVCLIWITAIRAANAAGAVGRFSTLAAWCVAVIAVSGVLSAAVRLGSWSELFSSAYGALVLVKAARCSRSPSSVGCTGVAPFAALGPFHCRTLDWRAFSKLARIEVAIMGATIGVAVALSRTPTPVGDEVYTSPVESLLGAPLPPAPDAARLAFGWTPERRRPARRPARRVRLYAAGLISMHRKGNSWPVGRTISWFAGLSGRRLGNVRRARRVLPCACSARTWSRTCCCRWWRRSCSCSPRRSRWRCVRCPVRASPASPRPGTC